MWQAVGHAGSLTDRIAAQIEALIASEELKPGDRLPAEREMAAMLAVSRPSLREAVRTLVARHRLTVRHGQGVFVAVPPSERELRAALSHTEVSLVELYAMREVLEVPAAEWAAERRTRQQLSGLRRALDQLDKAAAADPIDFDAIGAYDAEFHLRIVEAAGNRFMRQTLTVLQGMLRSGMETTLAIPGRLEVSHRDHHRIFAAIEDGNAAAARTAARAHIRGAQRAALERASAASKAG
jgi:GntR family transcriptional regulator, transcriptional repressor for pyruvate dehydrogenase complex